MLLGNTYTIPNIVNLPGQSGGGGTEDAFIMRVQTDISTSSTGKSNDDQFQIVVDSTTEVFDYEVDWGDGNTDSNVTGNITHTYSSVGTYDVKITGTFPNIYFFNRFDRFKVLEIKNWGNIEWQSLRNAFFGCQNMTITATDEPDFSNVVSFYRTFTNCYTMDFPSPTATKNWVSSNATNLQQMFSACRSLTGADCSGWDVSNVSNFSYCFYDNRLNTSVNTTGWDVSAGTNFSFMFMQCYVLEEIIGIEDWRFRLDAFVSLYVTFRDCRKISFDLSNWTVGKVNNFSGTFRSCYELGSLDLGSWDTSSATNMSQMFYNCLDVASLGDIDNWDVSNVTDFSYMFQQCKQLVADTSSWDTSSGGNFTSIFYTLNIQNAAEQTGYKNWDLSSCVGAATASMFFFGALGDAFLTEGFPSNWNIGNSTSLSGCFRRVDFGETNITCNITTSNLLTSCYTAFMELGYYTATSITFNSNFDVSGVTNASYMFANNGTFSISFPTSTDWGSVTTFQNFLSGTTLSSADYNALLIDIEASNQNNNVLFDAPNCVATGAGVTARTALINDHSWTINDSTP